MFDNDVIFVKDEYGDEQQMHLLCYFSLDEYQHDYVVFQDQNDEVYVAIAISDFEYTAIEDEKELDMVNEVAAAILEL